MQDSVTIRPALVLGAAALALASGFAGGFSFERLRAGRVEAPMAEVAAAPSRADVESQGRYRIPVSDSQPQRGPVDALVTVVEWCDLRGDPCRAADKALSQLMDKYKGRLRWVHRHHIDPLNFAASQRLHAFARGAFQYSDPDDPAKFWQVREKLLALPGNDVPSDAELRRIAEQVGVDYEAIAKGIEAKAYAGGLAIDNKFEPRFGITTAPAVFVNGRRVSFSPSVEMKRSIDALIQQEMVMAKRLADSGVTGKALYEEITKDGLWAINEDRSKRPSPRVQAATSLQSSK